MKSLSAVTMNMVYDELSKRILEELEIGIVKESTLSELPLILNSDNCPVICFDAVDIHLKKLVSLAME